MVGRCKKGWGVRPVVLRDVVQGGVGVNKVELVWIIGSTVVARPNIASCKEMVPQKVLMIGCVLDEASKPTTAIDLPVRRQLQERRRIVPASAELISKL